MSGRHSNLFYLIQRFPDRNDAIQRLFSTNQNFQIICDDYRRCARALEEWNESPLEKAPVRRKEYADLLQELELEILQFLNGIE